LQCEAPTYATYANPYANAVLIIIGIDKLRYTEYTRHAADEAYLGVM